MRMIRFSRSRKTVSYQKWLRKIRAPFRSGLVYTEAESSLLSRSRIVPSLPADLFMNMIRFTFFSVPLTDARFPPYAVQRAGASVFSVRQAELTGLNLDQKDVLILVYAGAAGKTVLEAALRDIQHVVDYASSALFCQTAVSLQLEIEFRFPRGYFSDR